MIKLVKEFDVKISQNLLEVYKRDKQGKKEVEKIKIKLNITIKLKGDISIYIKLIFRRQD